MTDDGTIPMFPVPKTYRPPRRDNRGLRIVDYKGQRTTCSVCILDVRENRTDGPINVASKKATKGEIVWLVCRRHAAEIKVGTRQMPGR